MSDILERAESLLEISNCSARAEEFRKSAADLLPELVAECNRLEEVLAGTTRGIEDARYECRRAMAEAARWQEAASTYKEIADSWENGSRYWQKRAEKAETAPGCPPRAWLMTEEKIKALEVMGTLRTEILCPECGAWMGIDDMKPYMAVLRVMLAEAKQ